MCSVALGGELCPREAATGWMGSCVWAPRPGTQRDCGQCQPPASHPLLCATVRKPMNPALLSQNPLDCGLTVMQQMGAPVLSWKPPEATPRFQLGTALRPGCP